MGLCSGCNECSALCLISAACSLRCSWSGIILVSLCIMLCVCVPRASC